MRFSLSVIEFLPEGLSYSDVMEKYYLILDT